MNEKPWYHSGLRFQCTGCGACCTGAPGYVWVNKAEIKAIASVLRLDVEEFEMRYVRRVGIRKSLVELADGDCVFFDSDRRMCQVYEVRPRQCRTWPFWASNLRTTETWERTCNGCPGANRGPLVPLSEIRARLGVLHV
jgi:Fe-S-cluster containining protein